MHIKCEAARRISSLATPAGNCCARLPSPPLCAITLAKYMSVLARVKLETVTVLVANTAPELRRVSRNADAASINVPALLARKVLTSYHNAQVCHVNYQTEKGHLYFLWKTRRSLPFCRRESIWA